jgi:hypothetical protein
MQQLFSILTCTAIVLCCAAGCSSGDAPVAPVASTADEVTYFCRETRQFVRAPRQPVPAVNPATGRKTLMLALYCPECRSWQAAPPPELKDRFPAGPICQKHKVPLQETDAPKTEAKTP